MPAIPPYERDQYDKYELAPPENKADLTYVMCRLVSRYVSYHGLRFDSISDVRSALGTTLHEFIRLVADPYEDKKYEMNGPVFQELTKLLESV